MQNIILFDDQHWKSLLPLTYTKPIAKLRVGILDISKKWSLHLKGECSYITQDYLSGKFPIKIANDNLVINSRWLPNDKLVSLIENLDLNDAILYEDALIAARMDDQQFQRLIDNKDLEALKGIELTNIEDFSIISRPFDLTVYNAKEIELDFQLLTKGRKSQKLNDSVQTIGEGKIFVEEGAKVEYACLNTDSGPIYIGKNAEIMEGCLVRGPFVLGDNAKLKMGAKVYGPTTIGPYCKVGGEVSSTVFQGYSNKAHDGYIGNSVIGEWCNLGADTNCSNLKNNYTEVKLWHYGSERFEKTGLQFCGLIMGDHSKAGINTMFNTGTVVGVGANIFGAGYPRNFIPSFSWGGSSGFKTFTLNKAFELAEIVMARRKVNFTDQDKIILEHIFHSSSGYRTWEK